MPALSLSVAAPKCLPSAARAPASLFAAAPAPARRCVATRAVEFDSDTLTIVLAAVAGVGLGIGAPVFYAQTEKRDKERIESIRQMNRANLKTTGQLMSEARALVVAPCGALARLESEPHTLSVVCPLPCRRRSHRCGPTGTWTAGALPTGREAPKRACASGAAPARRAATTKSQR